ncbi:Protein CBG27490 [Caenorhabditis briggsae]|uniref:Protein CBG27490 n=1 Tax=Caenorhabditis briggsae TaxID=6238 RepID=B6IF05_CAEBR|nr:Protein CBG27490 [Caenorhabditis briggsae]CAR98485.1 Protein CBG27490 [Caenorhabditis briggsae]
MQTKTLKKTSQEKKSIFPW